MNRITVLMAFLLLFTPMAIFAGDVRIQSDCVHLHELLGDKYSAVGVQCGFQPGDSKTLPSNVVFSALKRAGLPIPELDNNYTVTREGVRLDNDSIADAVFAQYQDAYPDREVELSAVRLGRDIYITADGNYSVQVDTNRLGAAFGTIVTNGAKFSFSFVVRLYQQGYVSVDRIATGALLTDGVKAERIDVTSLKSKLVQEPNKYIAAKSIVKGKPLTEDLVSLKPERVKGDVVSLQYSNGDIKIEISAIADGDAVVGKSFPVRNPSSGKIVNAIYLGNGKAVVK